MFGYKRKNQEVVKLPTGYHYGQSYQAIVDVILKRPPITSYQDLIPPSNPKYPSSLWKLLCYYCNQPIFYEKDGNLEAGYRQRGPLNMTWRHENHEWACKLENVRIDIDLPRCHVCGVQQMPHGLICSVGGNPSFHATTMSQKEDEVRTWFEHERSKVMTDALFDLLQVYEGNDSYHEKGLSLEGAVRRVLKASPWGASVK